jgi:mono/diheme cytochrome c family protein
MKKLTFWVGVFATGLISALTTTACSSTPDDSGNNNTSGSGTGGAGGSATTGGTSAVGGGTQLASPNYHTLLTGADAMPGQPAPAAYTAAGCNACHGANAEGTIVGPENRFTPKAYAVAVVRNGRLTPDGKPSAMVAVPVGTLSDADLDAINVWQNSLPKPTSPQGMYKAMCGNCHGPNMPTGGSAPISIQGKSKLDVQKYVRMGNGTDPTKRAEYMPAFDTTLLTDADLALIETYLGSM